MPSSALALICVAAMAGCADTGGDGAVDAAAPAVMQPDGLTALTGPGDPGPFPLGTYRFVRTAEDLLAAGAPPGEVDGNSGVWTWTFGEGTWRWDLEPSGTGPATQWGLFCEGWFTTTGDRLSVTTLTEYEEGECAPPVWTIRWQADGRDVVMGEMAEPNVREHMDYLWSGFPWKRIG